MLIEMKIKGLAIDPQSKMPIVLLTDRNERFTVPIWIGVLEASAIAVKLEGLSLDRPLTHDLMMNFLADFDARIERIVVHDLKDNTFFAHIHVRAGGVEKVFDARPSDSLALALRCGAPIWMEDAVIERAAVRLAGEAEEGGDGEKKDLADMTLADFPTKFKM